MLDAEGNVVVSPTPLEEANFVENAAPGALYTDTCPCHTTEECENVKVFEIALVQAKITYNQYGWHDPEGRFFGSKRRIGTLRWAGILYPHGGRTKKFGWSRW